MPAARLNRCFSISRCGGVGLAFALAVGSVCGLNAPSARASICTVTLRAHVPTNTGTVYLTGNCAELGPWNPAGLAMLGAGRERSATLHLPAGTDLEYKFTLGSWDREGLGPSGTVMPNYRLAVNADQDVTIEISDFKKGVAAYLDDWQGSGVLGRLEYWRDVPSKFLPDTRNVEIWLPPGYDEHPTNRYAVLYMHDGQNLFDPRIANTGVDWGVDEAIVRCVQAGKIPPLIVVGVWNTGRRLWEYSPWHAGTNYARFLIEELMPRVNEKFRTRIGPENTSVMGSSLGGLISFWLAWQHPETFGRAGCLSTAWQWSGKLGQAAPPLIENELARPGRFPRNVRLYFDYGTRESDLAYETLQSKISAWLAAQGLKEGSDFTVRKIAGAEHNETAWRARLEEPLTFLFPNRPVPAGPAPQK